MHCPYCTSNTAVVNSRQQKRSNSVWRRRKCLKCGAIWTSSETPDYATVWRIKKDGKLLNFEPETLYISLYEALSHKNRPQIAAKHLLTTVTSSLAKLNEPVITNEQIYETAYLTLRRFDKLAADIYKATSQSNK